MLCRTIPSNHGLNALQLPQLPPVRRVTQRALALPPIVVAITVASFAAAPAASATDLTPPSVPKNFSWISSTASSVTVGWAASTDNVAISAYDVYRDGHRVGLGQRDPELDCGQPGGGGELGHEFVSRHDYGRGDEQFHGDGQGRI